MLAAVMRQLQSSKQSSVRTAWIRTTPKRTWRALSLCRSSRLGSRTPISSVLACSSNANFKARTHDRLVDTLVRHLHVVLRHFNLPADTDFAQGLRMNAQWETILIITAFQLPGYFAAAGLVEITGRKRMLAIFLLVPSCLRLPWATSMRPRRL